MIRSAIQNDQKQMDTNRGPPRRGGVSPVSFLGAGRNGPRIPPSSPAGPATPLPDSPRFGFYFRRRKLGHLSSALSFIFLFDPSSFLFLSLPLCRLLILLLLLIGGIEPNPGSSRFPCGACRRNVRGVSLRCPRLVSGSTVAASAFLPLLSPPYDRTTLGPA